MAISVLAELMSYDTPFLCRKPEWKDGKFIFGCQRREIPNEEIPNILLFDDHVRCFVEGRNMFIDRTIWELSVHEDENGNKRHLIKQWHPTHEDLISGDWEIMDMSVMYEQFKGNLDEQVTEELRENG